MFWSVGNIYLTLEYIKEIFKLDYPSNIRRKIIATQNSKKVLPIALGLMIFSFGLIKISPPSNFRCSMAKRHKFNFV